MRGEVVIVRAFGDQPLVRRVWDEDESTVYITDGLNLQKLLRGEDAALPIGFPREDVVACTPDLAATLKRMPKGKKNMNWSKLKH